jgi:hypothetical protein
LSNGRQTPMVLNSWGKKVRHNGGERSEHIKRSPLGYRKALKFVNNRFVFGGLWFAELNFRTSFPLLPKYDPNVWRTFPNAFNGISRITSRVNYVVHKSSSIALRIGLKS